MRCSSRLSITIALVLFTTVTSSHAVPVLRIRAGTGTAGTVSGGNDYPFLAEPFPLTLNGMLETTGAGTLTFEYLGYEAGYVNSFLVGGVDCFRTGTSSVGQECSAGTTGGVLDFRFWSNLGGGDLDAVVWSNMAPPGSSTTYSVGLIQESPNSFLLLWDDSGAQDGDDHDDLGVRVIFQPKPVAETGTDALGLMLAGLVGAAGFVRRRQHGA
jgi:hypothetical protein